MKNNYKIIIAGGAGFVGSSVALFLNKNINNSKIYIVDNLIRKGSKLNLKRQYERNLKILWRPPHPDGS